MNISNGTMTQIPSASPTTIKFDVKPDDPSIIPSTDAFSPSSMPSSTMPSKPGQTKSPKSERPSVSIRPSLDPIESPSGLLCPKIKIELTLFNSSNKADNCCLSNIEFVIFKSTI